jgi:type I restriction enzyme, S subunit
MVDNDNNRTSEKENISYLPHGWQEIPLWEICENPVSGYSPVGTDRPARDDEVGVLKLNCIHENQFNPEKNKAVAGSKKDELKTPVSKNTLIISRSNTEDLVGAVCYVESDFPNLFLSDLLWRVSAKDDRKVDLKWLSYLLSFEPYRAKILARANGTSETMKKITKGGFLGIRILFPRLDEQKRIAQILSTWDIAIDQIGALIAVKKQRKKAFMQVLLLGKERLPGFHGKDSRNAYPFFDLPADWQYPQIRKIATERSERNKGNLAATVLSCSKHKGFVESSHYFGKQVHSEDTSNYKIIRRGWFGYPSNHIEEGSIGLLSDFELGIVSPIYTVFQCSEKIVPEYLYALFKTETFRHIFAVSTHASVDRRGSLRWKEFSLIRVPLPEKDEQQAIATVLKAADTEIANLENKRKALQKQKRGLMQKLLTGEVRVKI